MRHWQRDSRRTGLAVWAGVERLFMLSFRIMVTRSSASVSVALGPFYAGFGVP